MVAPFLLSYSRERRHGCGVAGTIVALARSADHAFSKESVESLRLIAGIGVEGDAHAGETVRHRSRIAVDPTQPNLRQVHLLHAELLDWLRGQGFAVAPGQLGENVLTAGTDLLALPRGTVLTIGDAQLEVAGLRNPCRQIEAFRPGLLAQLARRNADGTIERLAGIMSVVRQGGTIRPGDAIGITLPAGPHMALEPV